MSAATDERFNRVQKDYLKLVHDSLVRWDQAVDDMRNRRSSFSGLMSDAFASWMDVTTFSLSLLTNAPPSGQATSELKRAASPPALSLPVDKDHPTASGSTVVVGLPSGTPLKPTALTRTDSADGAAIPAAKVKAQLDSSGILTVQLVKVKKIAASKYSGAVNNAQGDVIAFVTVTAQ